MFDYLESSERSNQSVTMVLDKGLGLSGLGDLLATASSFIRIVKFGWGTSAVLDPELLRAKIDLIRSKDVLVCPGGTFFEMAYARRAVDRYLDEIRESGFTCVEISNGTFDIPVAVKLDLIGRARDSGLTVVSEIGKKTLEEDSRIGAAERSRMISRELEAGAWKVIVEARESGSLGIFDSRGEVRESFTEELVRGIDVGDVIFEAPNKNQQVWLMRRFGASVNLGNVRPEDAVSVETLRRGLRSDTVKDFLLHGVQVRLGLGVPGALEAGTRGDVVVVVDSLRASSTIVTALAMGMEAVVACATLEEGLGPGRISAGERGGQKIPGYTHSNSPLELREHDYRGRTLHLSTTNGTECIQGAARNGGIVLIGCHLNARAVARAAYEVAKSEGRNITLLTAGRTNKEALEDTLSATEIAHYLDDCPLLGPLAPRYSSDPVAEFIDSESGANLVRLGCRADVEYCAQLNLFDVAPILRDGRIVCFDYDRADTVGRDELSTGDTWN